MDIRFKIIVILQSYVYIVYRHKMYFSACKINVF